MRKFIYKIDFPIRRAMKIIDSKFLESSHHLNILTVLKAFFLQKILRLNSHVPWPVHPSSKIMAPEKIKHGSRSPGLSIGCHIDGRNGIDIGVNVRIAPYVSIISQNHDSLDYDLYTKTTSITIGNDCWIGAHSIILPGVTLGNHTIVGAGSVVTKSFPESNQIIAGNPAKFIKKLDEYRGEKT